MERRDIGLEKPTILQRDVLEEPSQIVGLGAVYYDGTEDTQFRLAENFVERIAPGAFDRAVREDDVVGLYNHNPDHLLGRTSSGTMRLRSTDRGLEYEIDIPSTDIAKQVTTSIDRGDLQGSSFAFVVTDQDHETVDGETIRWIRGVRLYDTGPVVNPAYSATDSQLREARASMGIDTCEKLEESLLEGEVFRQARENLLESGKAPLLVPQEPEPITEDRVPESFDEDGDEPEPAALDQTAMYSARARLAEIASEGY